MDFDLQPTLVGELVELRPLRPSDHAALLRAASDPKIWEQHPEPDRHTPSIFQIYFDGAIESGGAFAIVDRATGRIIGSSRYHHFDPVKSEVSIGFTFLTREFWGGAYNGEVKDLMLRHAFRFVRRAVFVVGEHNLRSQRALAKIGAYFLASVDRPTRDGASQRHHVYVIDRDPWLASHPPRSNLPSASGRR
ncbi:MAG: GNAT family N-acetyltransferase [Thermoplasmatota archaeon]